MSDSYPLYPPLVASHAFRRMLALSAAGHAALGVALVLSPRIDARPLEPLPIYVDVVERVEPPSPPARPPRQVVEEVVIPERPMAVRQPEPVQPPPEPVQPRSAEEIMAELREKLGSPTPEPTRTSAPGRFDPELAAYRKQLKALLYANWAGARVFRTQGRFIAHFRVEVDADGSVRALELVRTSGNRHFDESAERAIWRVAPFPAPPRGAFTLTLTFDPREAA